MANGPYFCVMDTSPALPIVTNRASRMAIATFFFIAGVCYASWASRIPDIKLNLGLSDAGLGGVLLALPIGLMVSLPFSGWLVTHLGSRKVVLLASLLYASVLPVIGLAQAPWQLVAVLFMFGFVGNMLNISVNTQAVSLEAVYGRSIMASFHGIWSLGGFTGAGIGIVMINFHVTSFQHFIIVSIAALIMAIIVHRYTLRKDINTDDDRPLFAWPDSTLLKLGLIALCCMISEGTMFDWSGVYFQKVLQVPKVGIKTILQCSGLVIAAGLVLAIAFPYLVTATLGFMLVGIGVSSVVPLVYGAAGKSSRFSPGVALAAVSTIGYMGFLAGPPLIGFIAQASSLRWSLALIAVLGFTTTIISSKTNFQK
jgi:MFS family permease